ncbi:hypothetical protein ACFL6S_01525 [Candidatus Poribacteria bacterium]
MKAAILSSESNRRGQTFAGGNSFPTVVVYLLFSMIFYFSFANGTLWADPPPPTVDTPLYDCTTRVVVRSFDSGATLRVYVNGIVKGTSPGATGSGRWVTLSEPLKGTDAVRVSQEVGGTEGSRSTAVYVAAPDPAPLIHFQLPLVECAEGSYVHNKMPGDIAIDSSSGDRLASQANNQGGFATYLSRQLVAGERLTATVDHCRLGTIASAETHVTNLYTMQERATIPVPVIRTKTAVECLKIVLVADIIPGAKVTIHNGAMLVGEGIATSTAKWVPLTTPMEPSWNMEARQQLCTTISDPSPVVSPIPLTALEPPVVEGPIWEGQSHVYVSTPISAPATVTVDGANVRENVEIYGRTPVNVENPFVAGEQVSAFYTICGYDSPPAPPVTVIKPPVNLPPPRVGFPLFACTNVVSVSGLLDQAEVVIFIDGAEVHRGFTQSSSASFTIGRMLRGGQAVTAIQQIGTVRSDPSAAVIVFDAPDLDPPTVEKPPLVACQREVVVSDVLPGAFVTVYVNGSSTPFASGYATGTTIRVQTFPLHEGWQIQARQKLNICQESGLSAPEIVDPFSDDPLGKAPTIVTPILACQTRFVVRDLTPGTELDVYIDDNFVKRVHVFAESMVIDVQPPLRDGQRIRVVPVACGMTGESSSEEVVEPPQQLDPPVLHEPIFNGDIYVTVSGAPPSSLVFIYKASGDQIGAGMGATPRVRIHLWEPAATNDTLTATASFCGVESTPSNVVTVQGNRSPLPHDAMVSYFWLNSGNDAQALLHVSGRNIYQASTVRIDGDAYTTFHMTQFAPDFGRDAATLGTPIDTIGGVVVLLYQDTTGSRFTAGQQLTLSVDNPGGSSDTLRHYNRAAGSYTDRYDLAASMATLDSDGDGLTDQEESPGATVDLAALGADPLRLDVFVEADWMVKLKGDGTVHHTHEPNTESFNRVINAFSSAWLINADGSRGVHLYVDYGQSGGRGGDELAHHDTIAFTNTDTPDVLYSQFYNNNFDANRQGLFHYAVFAHQQPGSGSSGVAYYVSDQLIITLINSGGINDSAWITKVAGTFIHELGHNLYLKHGGDTVTNRKPNYPSVMNYRYQFPGISTDCNLTPDGVYTYSYGMLADLDETNLDEPDGICDGVAIDWNGNGNSTETGISYNINNDKVSDYSSSGVDSALFNEYVNPTTTQSNQPLHDYCDWGYFTGLGVK